MGRNDKKGNGSSGNQVKYLITIINKYEIQQF